MEERATGASPTHTISSLSGTFHLVRLSSPAVPPSDGRTLAIRCLNDAGTRLVKRFRVLARSTLRAGIFMTTFLALNGVEVAINALGHDAFTWWSQIWIPAAVGLTTVFISVAALVASSRATDLARSVERQREAAATERAKDAGRQRLQDMAVSEARALTRWVMVATHDFHWVHKKVSEVGPSSHGPTLRDDARAMLEASLVPGAGILLDIIEAEIAGFFKRKPDPMFMPDRKISERQHMYANSSILEEQVPIARRERILTRIRSWALDPYAAQPLLTAELAALSSDEDRFLDYRRDLPDAGSLPPYEPGMRLQGSPEERAERLISYGLEAFVPDGLK
jgi:hypothetical protein